MSSTACREPVAVRPDAPVAVSARSLSAIVRRRLMGIDLREVSLVRRGITATSPAAGQRLEQIGETFVFGYHAALEDPQAGALATRLNAVERERRGFAYEGAAMALFLLDALTPWNRRRWAEFLSGSGDQHAYMVYVGAGWAMARLPLSGDRSLRRMDPLLRWLAVDGWAFHDAFFEPQRTVHGGERPRRLTGYALRAWDMGLGRGLWFAEGADATRIAERIGAMDSARRADLWSGVGLACAYAGGVEAADLACLGALAVEYRHHLGQGVTFAAKARQRAGNPADHTERACQLLCGMSADEAARITDECLNGIAPKNGDSLAFEAWRNAIVARLREANR